MGDSHGPPVIARRAVSSTVCLNTIGRLCGNSNHLPNLGMLLTSQAENAGCFSGRRFQQERKGTYRQRFTLFGHQARHQIQFKNSFNFTASGNLTIVGNALLPERTLAVKWYTNRSTAWWTLSLAARSNARHVAVSAVFGVDYLLTWNCKHIANAETLPRIYTMLRNSGFEPPLVVTPEEFSGNV